MKRHNVTRMFRCNKLYDKKTRYEVAFNDNNRQPGSLNTFLPATAGLKMRTTTGKLTDPQYYLFMINR